MLTTMRIARRWMLWLAVLAVSFLRVQARAKHLGRSRPMQQARRVSDWEVFRSLVAKIRLAIAK